jgi:hypothetical protein
VVPAIRSQRQVAALRGGAFVAVDLAQGLEHVAALGFGVSRGARPTQYVNVPSPLRARSLPRESRAVRVKR